MGSTLPTTTTALLATFACAALTDWLACLWHRARERGARAKGAALGALHELVTWTPVLLALEQAAPLPLIIGACVLGSVAGSALGFGPGRV